jgi:hypothetical protein
MKHIRPSDWNDVWYLAGQLRQADIEECAAHGHTPLDALAISRENSRVCYTLLDPAGQALGMAGVAGDGLVWLLGTPGIEKNTMAFLRHSMPVLRHFYREAGTDLLYNYTYSENKLHHKWLRWLGFTFIRQVTLPPLGKPFYEFARLKG